MDYLIFFKKDQVSRHGVDRKFKIYVIAPQHVIHNININDNRLDIQLITPDYNWIDSLDEIDGVIYLTRDSTLNNETLYMMAWGLIMDNSDIIVSNFYINSGSDRYWIRFKDLIIEKNRRLLRLLPSECFLFAGKYVKQHGLQFCDNLDRLKISYIEYPSFWINLPYYYARRLRFHFANHGAAVENFIKQLKNKRILKAISMGIDKIWQSYQLKRTAS
ncbi:hypothetical protein DBT_0803 [Dissulfuribacter thermophilus]|uniref:Uncharacterized protein n=1 Tax=Dissulfuribacter thermophilus TaxID=1156395 RepID=A0A1B9F7E6_9BACT|nr:hypothetical protein [Dissulfuribacter thermophilus]OCC15878.1 hypothetical protein DBT_0803 [Dissulfuribacter thermophilus]